MHLFNRSFLLFSSLVVTVAVLLTNGCAAIPKQTTPRAALLDPDQLNVGSALKSVAKAPAEWPSEQWWRLYADPQLDALVQQAIAGNPDLRAARARVTRVRSLAAGARSALLPQLNADAAFSRERFSENQFIPPPYAGNWSWFNDAALDLSWDLDLRGKNRAALAAALDYVQAASAEAQGARLALETAVVRAYVDLSLQHALLDIASSTLRQRTEILELARKRFAAGLGTELDLRQAETPLPAARAEIERISEAIELLHNQLAALTGKGPGDGESIRRPTLSLELPVQLPALLPADLLGRRPDVVAERWRVEATAKGIEGAEAAFYPDLNLSAFAGWQSLGFAKFLSPSSFVAGFTPALSLPIFQGGRLRAELGAARSDYDIAVESYNGTLIRALQKVADQVVSLRSLEKQRTEATASDRLAGRSYQIAIRAYRAGLADYLNVLNAQNLVLNEAQRKAQVEARYLDAYAALMQAVGGGVPLTAPGGRGK